jgi:hypothetical protein
MYALLTVGWLGAAVWALGWPVIDKLFLRELVFHVVEGEQKKLPGTLFYISPFYYLGRAAPWSIFGYLGLWRIARHPASNVEERRLERFLFCWFGGGLLLFSLAPHQRADLLWPILPAGALIAGRELARLTRPLARVFVGWAAAVSVLVAVGGFAIYFFGAHTRLPRVQQTVAVKRLAEEVQRRCGDSFPLVHTDDPAGLQVYLNTFREPISFGRAAELLRGSAPAYIAVADWQKLQSLRRPDDPPAFVLLEDNGPVPNLHIRIVSNRRALPMDRPLP